MEPTCDRSRLRSELTHMKRGDVIVFKDGVLAGAKGVIVRKSKRTGGLTVELLEDKGAYRKGEDVNVAQYDVRSATETR